MRKIIIYDFDGTLTPYSITNFGILEKCGFVGGGNNQNFQKIVHNNMLNKNIDVYRSFYETIFNVIELNGYILKDETFSLGADKIEYNKGIYEFFEYLKECDVDNYIISSSMKVFLDKTIISKYIKETYATTFKYDSDRNIVGLKNLMTDERKIDSIKTIVKDDDYSKVIYIGDGLTDLKAMEFVKNNGGVSIYVTDNLDVNYDDVVSYYFNRDYSFDSELFHKIKEILDL